MSTQPLEWAQLWAAMDSAPGSWIPTTENMYWEMLGCVPPAAMGNGGFLVGEAHHHNENGEAVYACFRQNGETFEACYMTKREFSALKVVRSS